MEFSLRERPKILEDLGPKSTVDIGRELGLRWRSLTQEEKLPFELKAKENKTKYDLEKKLYKERKETDRREETASAVSGADDGTVTNSDNSILPSLNATDLGFAKQKKYSWHPALKVGMLAKGTRVKVQFFGTGQTGIVDSKNWVTYSVKTESRIKSKELMKDVAFRNGLIELHNLHQKLMVDPTSVSAPGITFVPEVGARKFRNLDKERLQKEDDENTQLLENQMVFVNDSLGSSIN